MVSLTTKTSVWKVVTVARKVIDEPSEDVVANAKVERAGRRGPFARLTLFIQQVINELKKVVTPTRKELFSYTGVVLVFVVIMMTLVTLLDLLFGFVVANVFGDGTLS
ncbi:MAG: preprotein translocase subunit SecE [Homoserinimonas sp.]|nr:preprotein translocase subunit SecE [Homoserinimonas sp.]